MRIDLDAWQEILDTVRRNKLRTFLTGFSVAWGILILVVLLGCGQGLARGIEYDFRDDATNSIWMRSGQTSLPWKGLRPGRSVQFTNEDYDTIRSGLPAVDHITSRFFVRGNLTVVHRGQTGNFDVRAVHPDHQYLEKTIVVEGRFLNPLDVQGYRKVAVIGERVKAQLFKGAPALGEHLAIKGVPFLVVGVFTDEGGEGELERIYIPISTAQRTYGGADRIIDGDDDGRRRHRRREPRHRRRPAPAHRGAPRLRPGRPPGGLPSGTASCSSSGSSTSWEASARSCG